MMILTVFEIVRREIITINNSPMQKAVKQQIVPSNDQNVFLREQQFSFVRPANKNQYAQHPMDPTLGLSRLPQPPAERTFEVTFQSHGDLHIDFCTLKREENDNIKNNRPQVKIEEFKEAKEFQEKESGLLHEELIQKTEHSSSSDADEREEKPIEFEQSHANAKAEPMKTTRLSYLIKKSETQNEYLELNCELPNVYESQILLNKGIEDYAADRANICGSDYIQFSKFKISLAGMQKLKIYPLVVKKKSFRIKITHDKEVYNFGVELRRELYYLPEHYIWFAKLINARLMKMGCKMMPSSTNSSTLHTNGIFNQGVIYKCSKYRKKWEKRFILINNEGLFSYKNPKESYTVSIPTATIEELWTNFELFGSHLIIKLKHKGDKTEFAIPVIDYCLKEDSLNWLFSFYRLLMEHKIHIKI